MPLADSHHDLSETRRTVSMSKKAIGRMHTMYLSIRPLRNPALLIKGRSGLISKESADTTDVEQRRLAPRSGRRLMSQYLNAHVRQDLFSCVLPHCYRNPPTQAHSARYQLLRFLVFLLRYRLLGLLSLLNGASLNQRAVGSTPTRPTKNQPLTSPPPSSQSPCRHSVGSKTEKIYFS